MNFPFYEDLAVLFLSELALLGNSRCLSVTQVAQKHKVSPLLLKKIANLLRNSGFIKSKEGLHGGYNLSVDPKHVTLWDIYSAIDQSRIKTELQVKLPYTICPINNYCLPQIIRKSVRSAIKESLQSITIFSLIGKASA